MPEEVGEGRAQAARAAQADAAVVGRVHGHAHLPRVARRAALVQAHRGPPRPRPRRATSSTPITTTSQKVKKRILEYLAVRKLAPRQEGPDPVPGRAARRRQDLARQVDRARARPRVHPRLAGRRARRGRDPRPPAHLHRRAARPHHPGHASARARNNPVFMLDEIDKLGADFRGDPSAALLEVLDPEQNNTFSRSLPRGALRSVGGHLHRHGQHARRRSRRRCSTAWRSSSCPATRARRSCEIAKRHLVPKQLAEHGLTDEHDRALRRRRSTTIIEQYTREAGVRNLEREIANVIRGIAVKVAASRDLRRRLIGHDQIADYLGPPKFYSRGRRAHGAVPGVATGLAWTPTGGDILFIEATRMAGKGQPRAHRAARRRHEGVGAGGAVVRARARRRARASPADFREERHAPARAGRRGAQGRTVGGRRHHRRRWCRS